MRINILSYLTFVSSSHLPQRFYLCVSLSPNMDQALRGQHRSIEEESWGVWMWSTKCTPILSTFEFNGHKKEKKKIMSPKSIWKKWQDLLLQTSEWLIFLSKTRSMCVSLLFFLCCYLSAWTEKDTLPTTVLKICCLELGTYWYVCKISIY